MQNGLHVSKVHVDLAGHRDHLGHGLDALLQHGVRQLQGVVPRLGLLLPITVIYLKEPVVGNSDEGVNVVL